MSRARSVVKWRSVPLTLRFTRFTTIPRKGEGRATKREISYWLALEPDRKMMLIDRAAIACLRLKGQVLFCAVENSWNDLIDLSFVCLSIAQNKVRPLSPERAIAARSISANFCEHVFWRLYRFVTQTAFVCKPQTFGCCFEHLRDFHSSPSISRFFLLCKDYSRFSLLKNRRCAVLLPPYLDY